MSKIVFFFASAFLLSLFLVSNVQAQDFILEGNAENSQNLIQVNQQNNKKNSQGNNTSINNNIKADSNTGNNSAIGDNGSVTIKTGNAQTTIRVVNKSGNNDSKINGCCGSPAPSGRPSNTPSPLPSSDPVDPSDPSSETKSGTNGGSQSKNDPQILGLSNTAGADKLSQALSLLGASCIFLAGKKFLKR